MEMLPTADRASTSVGWEFASADVVAQPLARELPYLELKLEHPDLDAAGYGDRFFPDVIPYEFDGTRRVWYWRPALSPSPTDPGDWDLACATTGGLRGLDSLPAPTPPLVGEDSEGTDAVGTGDADETSVVVQGTVGGDVTTSRVRSYSPPDISIARRPESAITVLVDGTEHTIERGDRRRIRLAERRVVPVATGRETTTTPELVVRYPGRRELHHPAPGASDRLFPSFGLALETVPNPVSVPTTADELDENALAESLSLDLADRPYPERVLWRAFAHTAFDPHDDRLAELTQLRTGHIVVRGGTG